MTEFIDLHKQMFTRYSLHGFGMDGTNDFCWETGDWDDLTQMYSIIIKQTKITDTSISYDIFQINTYKESPYRIPNFKIIGELEFPNIKTLHSYLLSIEYMEFPILGNQLNYKIKTQKYRKSFKLKQEQVLQSRPLPKKLVPIPSTLQKQEEPLGSKPQGKIPPVSQQQRPPSLQPLVRPPQVAPLMESPQQRQQLQPLGKLSKPPTGGKRSPITWRKTDQRIKGKDGRTRVGYASSKTGEIRVKRKQKDGTFKYVK